MLHAVTMHILRFHTVHGAAIVLSEDCMVATRSGDFCNGIAFSSSPVRVNQKVCLELTGTTSWSGAIRVGVTSQDPSSIDPDILPRYVCPDLTSTDGNWARGIPEKYAESGNRITFYVNSSGQMHYFVNNEHKGILLNHIATNAPLWALFDIYGNTSAAKFVPTDEAPVEILARGPEAMQAYQKASESGSQPVFRTRLMLVGQDRVGKTSLKHSLTGQSYNKTEMSTDGIDLSASCSFNLNDRQAWKLALKGPPEGSSVSSQPDAVQSGTAATDSLEEEYYQAIANNKDQK